MGGIERKGRCLPVTLTILPCATPRLPRSLTAKAPDPLNIAVFVVAPMDSHGYFNLGPCASHLA